MILCAWVLFAVGSLVSMTATSMTAVIAGQVLSGVASGISGIMFAVASEVIPGAYRAYGQTIVRFVEFCASHQTEYFVLTFSLVGSLDYPHWSLSSPSELPLLLTP